MVDEYESLCDTISEIPSDEDIHSDIHSDDMEVKPQCKKLNFICDNGIYILTPYHILENSKTPPLEVSSKEVTPYQNDDSFIEEMDILNKQRHVYTCNTINNCSMNKHCWCEIKYRLNKLKMDILEVKDELKTIHIETQQLIHRIQLAHIQCERFS
jgi:hypothetical protein